jgi:hypothetical protein
VTASPSTWTRLVLGAVLPVAVSAVWIPVRDRLPDTDLALLLVLVIGTIGWMLGARAALISAVTAAMAFDVLDTRPYETLTIARGVDVTTALILLATGLLVGAGAARLARYRHAQDHRSDALAVVMEASGLVATGGERQLITEALGAELVRALQLEACEFAASPPDGTRPAVARDGSLVGLLTPRRPDDSRRVDLPIWCQGEVVAHYRLTLGLKTPSRQEFRVALSLADQAGAAMVSTGDHRPPPPGQPAGLRLLPTGPRPEAGDPGDPQAPAVPSPGGKGAFRPDLPPARPDPSSWVVQAQ